MRTAEKDFPERINPAFWSLEDEPTGEDTFCEMRGIHSGPIRKTFTALFLSRSFRADGAPCGVHHLHTSSLEGRRARRGQTGGAEEEAVPWGPCP